MNTMVEAAGTRAALTAEREEAILRRCQAGDWSEYRVIVERYQRLAWAAVDAVLSEPADVPDVVQETFIKTFEKLSTFKFQSSFSSWLYRVARNQALNHLRKQSRRPRFAPLERPEAAKEPFGHGSVAKEPAAELVAGEQGRALTGMLNKLPRHYREVINLYYLGELSYEEIAGHLDRPLNTVRTHLKRAREQLSEMSLKAGWRED